MPSHHVASVLGAVAALIVGLAIGVDYGYLSSSTVGGLTVAGLVVFAALTISAAIAAYVIEDRDSHG